MPPTPTKLLKNFFNCDPKYFYYFAYGSNLLKERLHVMNPTAEFVEVGFIQGYSLGFYGTSTLWHGSYATVYKTSPDAKVFGCVWRLKMEDSQSLDLQEIGYRRIDVDVHVAHEPRDIIKCRTYEILDIDRFIPGKDLPSPHYKHVIVSGAIEHRLPEEYIKQLKAIPDNGYVGPVWLKLKALTFLNNETDK